MHCCLGLVELYIVIYIPSNLTVCVMFTATSGFDEHKSRGISNEMDTGLFTSKYW